jgi:hypothetical protein
LCNVINISHYPKFWGELTLKSSGSAIYGPKNTVHYCKYITFWGVCHYFSISILEWLCAGTVSTTASVSCKFRVQTWSTEILKSRLSQMRERQRMWFNSTFMDCQQTTWEAVLQVQVVEKVARNKTQLSWKVHIVLIVLDKCSHVIQDFLHICNITNLHCHFFFSLQ